MATFVDPAMLDVLQSPRPTKRVNPVPCSRIPRALPLNRSRISDSSTGWEDRTRNWTDFPVYMLTVVAGHEISVSRLLRRWSPAIPLLPVDASNQPLMPGYLFVSVMSDADLDVVRQLIRQHHLGVLSQRPVESSVVMPFLRDEATPADPWGPDHPLADLLREYWFARGWHASWLESGWAIFDAAGLPVVTQEAMELWRSLRHDWLNHHSMATIIRDHLPALVGTTYRVQLDHTPLNGPWTGVWMGRPFHIPADEHQKFHLRSHTVWAVLTEAGSKRLTFRLRSKPLMRHRLGHQLSYVQGIRRPGQWGAVLVDDAQSAQAVVTTVAQDLGWEEPWHVVAQNDPDAIIRTLLRPQDVQFDAAHQIVLVSGIPRSRRGLVAAADRWLAPSGWLLVPR
ncbi:hypothetical protein [Sulfobacillus thermosulfidooxidans]|uniref:hypothetical protein n=1 Tax=Sulfobacillus thermosulfidooxidans TaxID=28034 RepID=UPI0004752344|nr:hypothetical protein [Sulfobacillus thermosulfidooxidans]